MSVDFIFRLIGLFTFGPGGVWLGVQWADLSGEDTTLGAVVFGLVGVLVGVILTPHMTVRPVRAIRAALTQASARSLFAGIVGLIVALVVSALLSFPISMMPEPYSQIIPIILALFMSYIGVVIFTLRQTDLFYMWQSLSSGRQESVGSEDNLNEGRTILMDTSVIIDGRISDIARTGFLEGELLIPRFVLNELQFIADAGDNLRRQRGRRGLEVLSNMQKDENIKVRISDIDVEGAKGVDDKLVILARQINAPVLTNDYNLNRVAEIQGVKILNINELANAVKVVFLPGEELVIRVIQEGRESGQGIGYLEDGTMVVVQDGNKFIGKELNTVVTKILQTAAGRMIFSKPEDK